MLQMFSSQVTRNLNGLNKKRKAEVTQVEFKSSTFSKRRCYERPGLPKETHLITFVLDNKPSPPIREDDENGHYVFELGENISSRYKILSKMGEGTYGQVLKCWDRKTKGYVALKIIRNLKKYRIAAMIELQVLNAVERNDPLGQKHCIALREWFDYRGHVCMAFEKLGPSLFDFLRRREYKPLPLRAAQEIMRQLLEAVEYLHEIRLIHTDLKPENILLVDSDSNLDAADINNDSNNTESTRGGVPMDGVALAASPGPGSYWAPRIKLIDFGSAAFDDEHHSALVSTRHYRAPEVIIEAGWSFPCDCWSIGCILYELLTGSTLFQTHEDLEHLAMMQSVLGPIPPSMGARASGSAAQLFASAPGARAGLRLRWPDDATSRRSLQEVRRLMPLPSLLRKQGGSDMQPYVNDVADLLQGLLQFDPKHRLTAGQALRHRFFNSSLSNTLPPPPPLPPRARSRSRSSQAATAAAVAAEAGRPGVPRTRSEYERSRYPHRSGSRRRSPERNSSGVGGGSGSRSVSRGSCSHSRVSYRRRPPPRSRDCRPAAVGNTALAQRGSEARTLSTEKYLPAGRGSGSIERVPGGGGRGMSSLWNAAESLSRVPSSAHLNSRHSGSLKSLDRSAPPLPPPPLPPPPPIIMPADTHADFFTTTGGPETRGVESRGVDLDPDPLPCVGNNSQRCKKSCREAGDNHAAARQRDFGDIDNQFPESLGDGRRRGGSRASGLPPPAPSYQPPESPHSYRLRDRGSNRPPLKFSGYVSDLVFGAGDRVRYHAM